MESETYVVIHPTLMKKLLEFHKDEDNDVKELFKEIFEVTIAIKTIYDELYKLLTNIDTPDFETKLRNLLYNLSILKIEEGDLYDYVEKLPLDLIKEIDRISKLLDTPLDEMNRLAYRRILNNLESILMLSDETFLALGENYFNNNRQYQFLLDNGVDKDDAISFFTRFKYNFEKSISYRYTTIINEQIKDEKNPRHKDKLIKIKLDTTFVRGNEIEDDLISSSFTTVKNDLAKEMEPNYGIDPLLKKDYQNITALLALHHNIEKLRNLKLPNPYFDELLIEFKTFLLYISDENIQIFAKNLSKTVFKTPTIKGILFECIKNLKEDKKIHYQDSEQKHL